MCMSTSCYSSEAPSIEFSYEASKNDSIVEICWNGLLSKGRVSVGLSVWCQHNVIRSIFTHPSQEYDLPPRIDSDP